MQNSSRPWSDRRMVFFFTPLTLPWMMEPISYYSFVWIRVRFGVWMQIQKRRNSPRGGRCITMFWDLSCRSWRNIGVWELTIYLGTQIFAFEELWDAQDDMETNASITIRILRSTLDSYTFEVPQICGWLNQPANNKQSSDKWNVVIIMLVCIRLKGFVCANFTIDDDGH